MVGIDVVHVSRIENVCDMSAFIDKYFSVREKKYVFDKNERTRAQTVAGLFAAKEAVLKLVGCGLTHAPRRVEVLDLQRGLACYQTQLYQLTPLELPATHEGFLARPLSVG